MSSSHGPAKSPKPVTYTPRPAMAGPKFACNRCGREHPYPVHGAKPIRCECGWWYENREGRIEEQFKPRLGV